MESVPSEISNENTLQECAPMDSAFIQIKVKDSSGSFMNTGFLSMFFHTTAMLGMPWRHWRTTHNLAKQQMFKEYLQCDSRQICSNPCRKPVLLVFLCCAATWVTLPRNQSQRSQLTPRLEKNYYWGDGFSALCFPSANRPQQFSCNSWSTQLVTNSQVKGVIFSRYKRNYMTDLICFPFHPRSLLCTCTSFPLQKIWFCFASFSCQPVLGTQRSFCILYLLFFLPHFSS